jgi:hypothetical protein
VGQVLLDATIDDAAVRAASFARVPEAVLRTAVDETAGLIRPRQDDAIDFFDARYSTIRQFAPAFLRTLTFHPQGPDDTVLRADPPSRAARRPNDARHGRLASLHGPTGGKLRRDLTGESRFPFYSSALAVHVENHLPSRLSRLQNRVKVPVSTVLGNAPCREFETANAHSEAIISFPSVG